jgi:hypothetical protein
LRFRSICVFVSILGSMALPAAAQAPPWTIGDITFSGLIDGYYSHNFNNPASGYNTLRNFEVKSRQFTLNMAELSLYKPTSDTEPIGFRMDLGFGRAWDVFHATDPGDRSIQRLIPQAFMSVRPEGWGGFQFDFGKFYTSVGAELTENNLTWHYGRGYMYTNGPYYHFGARITKPLTNSFTVGMQLVNGWNNVEDNNTGKTLGFTTAWTSSKVSWLTNTYVGPEKTGTNAGWRQIYDTVLNFTPTSRISGYLDYYHGRENEAFALGGPAADWDAFGASVKLSADDHNAFAFRYEYYSDHDGFITGYGSPINLQEFTATYEYKWTRGMLTRLEYRRDWSDKPFFERGSQGQPLNPGIGTFTPGPWKNQDTLTIGFVAFFGGN